MGKGGTKKVVKKPKKIRKGRKHESIKPNKIYEVNGDQLVKKRKACPRCGDGTWLSNHKNRAYCGRGGYTIFEKREA
ncbi:MAG: 30S ribosomal protein S27ae [Nanoarchaeota archaeon]|nr:30S ribosomal protein S27ae [Nanoarchaeota archaeon]